MSFGTYKFWRLLSPFVALLWIVATVGFARAATADNTTDPSSPSAGGQETAAAHRASTPDRAAPSAAGSTSTTSTGGATTGTDHGGAGTGTDHGGAGTGTTSHGGTSGDVTSPQPISKADANSGGANGQCPGGPYCSTRDGSPSANGNGGGQATGKPCAGCVGKADNKNPKGQMPNGSDANAGYECDTNHGIGRTNPAHTGCKAPQQECVPTTTHPCVPTPPCVPTATHPCVPTPPCVPTTTHPCVPTPPCVPADMPPCAPTVGVEAPQAANQPAGAVLPESIEAAPQGGLPNTGAPSDLALLAAAGLASVLAGTALLAHRRRALQSVGRHLAG